VVTSANGNYALAIHVNDNGVSTALGTGTQLFLETAYDGNQGAGRSASSGSSTTLSWTFTGAVGWANAKVDVIAFGGGSPYTMAADVIGFTETGVATGLLFGHVVTAAAVSFTLTGNDAILAKPQVLRPSSDISVNGWTSTGANLWSVIDEDNPSDADYISSPANPAGEVAEVKLSSGIDPVSSTGHVVRYRVAATGQDAAITVALYCGATPIASWAQTLTADAGGTNYQQTLSSGQADAITDYTDLRLRFSAAAP
jgi:hypothetical protein